MTLKEMKARLAAIRAEGRALATEESTLSAVASPSAEQTARLAALDTHLTALENEKAELEAKIDREEKRQARAASFGGAAPAAQPRRVFAGESVTDEPNPATTGGFRSMAEFATVVRNASRPGGFIDERLAAVPAQNLTGSGSSGEGFLIPPQYRTGIWEMVFEEDSLLRAVAPEPASSPIIKMLKDETTPWGATGVQAFWRGKDAQLRASKPGVTEATIELHALDAYIVADELLLADAPLLASRLTTKAAQAIRWVASEVIMTGDGVGKPVGFMNSGAKIAIAKESGQAADTLHVQNIIKAYSRLLMAGGSPFWIANQDTLPQLVTLAMPTSNAPAWVQNAQALRDAPDGILLGRPVRFMEHASTLGDEGDLTLINPAGYQAYTSAGGGIDFAASIHLFFDFAKTAFRWTFRMGGAPILSAPVSPAKGTSTKSHFITIAERA